MNLRGRLVTSVTAFALACLVMITLHELAHAVAGALQGNSPVMFGFSVDQQSQTNEQAIVTALAGPVFSLVSGLLVLAVPIGRLAPIWRLVVLWFGLLSVQEFSGYLITGPFANVGDIGSALQRAGAPAVVAWLGFVVGWGLTYLLARHAVPRFAELTADGQPLAPQMRALGLFAWLIGVGVVIVLSIGLLSAGGVSVAIVVFEALGLVASGIFLVFVRLFWPLAERAPHRGGQFPTPVVAIVLVFVVALARQLLLSGGLHF